MAQSPLLARKSVADICASGEATSVGLHKTLGAASITAMGIGGIIGAGIFVLTGTAAAQYAGPGIMISFVVCAIACSFVGLCYAELAALIPVSGSSYTYTYATLGELFAWIIGWDLVLEYAVSASTVAVGWSGYAVRFLEHLEIHLPQAWAMAPFDQPATLADGTIVHGIFNLPAAAIIAIITTLLVMGTRESARTNNIMVAVKLAVVLLFIGLGLSAVNPDNWVPVIPENTGEFGAYGWSGVLRGASVVFFAFIGFDAVSTAAQEAKNPQRDMPIGILGSLAICTILYVVTSAVMTGMVHYTQLNVAAPIGVAVDVLGMKWLSVVIDLGVLAGLTTVILVSLYGQTRIFYTMAHDGLLPPVFARIHPGWKTPWLSQIMIGFFVAIAAGLAPLDILGELVSIGTLFAFILVCGAVIYLRKYEADRYRPFRVPGVPIVPIAGILCCVSLMFFLPVDTWLRLAIWLAIGLVIYFTYGRRHSVVGARLRQGDG